MEAEQLIRANGLVTIALILLLGMASLLLQLTPEVRAAITAAQLVVFMASVILNERVLSNQRAKLADL